MQKELPPFYYGIMRIIDCGFAIEEAVNPDIEAVQIGYGMNFLFDSTADWIMYGIRADFKDAKTGVIFASGTVQTTFSVRDLKNFIDENDQLIFPNGSLESLFGIAFDHLRAILAKNLGGTRFSTLYVPVIDADKLFNDLLDINIQKFQEAQETKNSHLKKEDKSDFKAITLAPTDKSKRRPQ